MFITFLFFLKLCHLSHFLSWLLYFNRQTIFKAKVKYFKYFVADTAN